MVESTNTFAFYNQFYYENGLTLKPDMEVATTDLVLPFVKSNLGIGFIPAFYADEAIKNGECWCIPLIEKLPERSICLVQDSGRSLNVAAMELKKFLMDKRTFMP
ncbi:MAG: LysR family transcriptional regulator substrate-binding protein, partial [Lachnospiraceae bacterium]|nr:LysR family transcriptional regulator substrate-binding protein [Lachnospiraceae bacterium]